MSPRSEEFLAQADRFLAAARGLLDIGIPENAAAEAYRAMFYAARAALSEEDRYAKTHHGTWVLFSELFVATGRFEKRLYDAARTAEELRLDSDYGLGGASPEEAQSAISAAEEFMAAVREMFE